MNKEDVERIKVTKIHREPDLYGDLWFVHKVVDELKLVKLPTEPKEKNGWGRIRGSLYPNLIKIPSPYSSMSQDWKMLWKADNVRRDTILEDYLIDIVKYCEKELEKMGIEIINDE